jgi:hypothetical protein
VGRECGDWVGRIVADFYQDEEDGDWIAPLVPNPKCEEGAGCGPWTQPKIKNPDYKVRLGPDHRLEAGSLSDLAS